MSNQRNEAFSRVLIDKALEYSGWDLLNPQQVQFEFRTADGRADYLLKDSLGRVLCVLEAKREDIDPYDAKEQARGYAENLRAPFVILSNGHEHWFWNFERADQRDAYRIERLPSREDLERLRLKNLQPPRPLQTEIITPAYLRQLKPDLALRGYQIRAMDEIAKQFDDAGLRKFLLEMATGTGKTLLCAALIRRFLLTRNAERVLFIVDRIELAKQTMEDFNVVLGEFKPVIYKTARRTGELLGSSVVIATIQSLMMDRRYREEFTPFYFDLVINDEAHRSIYGDAREVVQFFQSTRIGLTATPKAYLKNINTQQLAEEDPKALEARQLRDTYHYFGCESDIVKFLEEARGVIADYDIPGYEELYKRLLRDLLRKYNLRYRLDEPFKVCFLLPGSFTNLYAELHRLNSTNAHLASLLAEFEHVFDRYARTQDPTDLKTCIAKASNYAEGLASVTLGIPASGNTLGTLCNQISDWPHDQVKEALQRLYKFCSDYPGIRHAGNPTGVRRILAARDSTLMSLLLLSFTGYLSPLVDEKAVLGV